VSANDSDEVGLDEAEQETLDSDETELGEAEQETLDSDEAELGEAEEETLKQEVENLKDRENDLRRLLTVIDEYKNAAKTAKEKQDVLEGNGASIESDIGGVFHCPVCGSETDETSVEEQLEKLQEKYEEILRDISEVESDIDRKESRLSEIKQEASNKEDKQSSVRELEAEIPNLEKEAKQKSQDIEDMEKKLSELRDEASEIGDPDDVNKQIEERKDERMKLKTTLNTLKLEKEDLEEQIEEAEKAEDELEITKESLKEIQKDITELENRIENIEKSYVEIFNDNMDKVIDILEYDAVERVRIERKVKDDGVEFELSIVREDEEGNTYTDSRENLSESELEAVSLIFSLAGYEAYDVNEEVPFILLDSLSCFDSQRVENLLEYFGEKTDYVVASLLPETESQINLNYNKVAT